MAGGKCHYEGIPFLQLKWRKRYSTPYRPGPVDSAQHYNQEQQQKE